MADEATHSNAKLTEHGIRVLLVDDQAMVAEAVRRMLAPESEISFFYCRDPGQALKMAAEVAPTVILQDLVMPEIDGLTLVKFYMANPKLRDVPVIVLSTKEEPATKAEAFGLGASDYLVKLPDRVELVARIRHHSQGYINLLQRNEAFQALRESERTLAAQLGQAAEYVISLLPKPLDDGPIRASWRFVPSAQLGGDSFGYHYLDPENFAVYLLDVCDHGVGPALLSVSAINVLRSQSLADTDFKRPEAVLGALNDAFQMSTQNDLYFTMFYGVYNFKTRKMTFGSAGHPPPLLIAPDGTLSELRCQSLMIGAMPGVSFKASEIEIPPGSKLFVFSDGVYEIRKTDGLMWNYEEFKEVIKAGPQDGVQTMDRLYSLVKKLGGSEVLVDDFSILKLIFET